MTKVIWALATSSSRIGVYLLCSKHGVPVDVADDNLSVDMMLLWCNRSYKLSNKKKARGSCP